jgi:hypothetical protein
VNPYSQHLQVRIHCNHPTVLELNLSKLPDMRDESTSSCSLSKMLMCLMKVNDQLRLGDQSRRHLVETLYSAYMDIAGEQGVE